MHGMNALTGRALPDIDHVIQSIGDILRTPLGSRVERRAYGSRVSDLLDAPPSRGLIVDVFAAVADALDRHEPRFRVVRVEVTGAAPGRMTINLEGEYRPSGEVIDIEGLVIT